MLEKDGKAYLVKNFYEKLDSTQLLTQLLNEIPWQERSIKMFGKQVLQPRKMCWMGDSDCTYKYSGTEFSPMTWSKTVLDIKSKIESHTDFCFNSVLLNLYRDENDSMGLHSDNEKELGDQPLIASLSLGEARPFIFRHKTEKTKVKITLDSGDLLIMQGDTQKYWKHELPKLKQHVGPRINLTFRWIYQG